MTERLHRSTITIRIAESPSTRTMYGGMIQTLRAVDLETADKISSPLTNTHPHKPSTRGGTRISGNTMSQTSIRTSLVRSTTTSTSYNRFRERSASIIATIVRAIKNPLPTITWNAWYMSLGIAESRTLARIAIRTRTQPLISARCPLTLYLIA